MIKHNRVTWENRAHFYGVAAQMMRRILVDHARARKMAKRSGQWARVSLVDLVPPRQPHEVDVLDLHTALDELAAFDPRKSAVAELRSSADFRWKRPVRVLRFRSRPSNGNGRPPVRGCTHA